MKIRKEILTKENIKEDLIKAEKNRFENTSERWLIAITTFLLLAVFIGILTRRIAFAIPFVLIAVYPTVRYILAVRESNVRKKRINDGEFLISVSKLEYINEERIYEPHRGRRHGHATREVTFFYFLDGKWRLNDFSTHYEWSDLYAMSAQGVINSSLVGDEFYVIINPFDHNIDYAYNRSRFELKE